MNLLSILAGIFTGSAGQRIGGTVARAAELAAVIAAIAPVVLWLRGHKDEIALTITYGELAFWGALVGALVVVIVRLVHRAPPPA